MGKSAVVQSNLSTNRIADGRHSNKFCVRERKHGGRVRKGHGRWKVERLKVRRLGNRQQERERPHRAFGFGVLSHDAARTAVTLGVTRSQSSGCPSCSLSPGLLSCRSCSSRLSGRIASARKRAAVAAVRLSRTPYTVSRHPSLPWSNDELSVEASAFHQEGGAAAGERRWGVFEPVDCGSGGGRNRGRGTGRGRPKGTD